MSRDSEAPRDEPQPLTATDEARLRRWIADDGITMIGKVYVAKLLDRVQRLEAENARLRKATDGISDYGWSYDGRTTFTVNCTDRTAAATLMTAIEESKTRDSDLWNRREILSPTP